MAVDADKKPVLVYDGDCGICREWVEYWQVLTADNVTYLPYQDAASDYPEISLQEFEEAIQYIESDGSRCSGARASYMLYRNTAPYSLLVWMYDHVPGFGRASEICYRFFSCHRGLLSFITHLFWGRGFKQVEFHTTTWIFLRLLGLIYLSAFLSFYVQAAGLIGKNGILPLDTYLDYARSSLGNEAYYRLPVIFWFFSDDWFLDTVCLAGALFSLFVVFNFMTRISLVLLFIFYLSLVYAGQQFMSFQWDMLLLETGFLAVFLNHGSHIITWLYRWLVFRFMFMGGLVKILSNDPAWRDLTALQYHFETQPLPSPLAWYAHHLPDGILKACVALTLITELILPFLIFMPRRFRHIAAWGFIIFQSCIILTGNYNFFNLLTIALCLLLFDDAAINKLIPARLVRRITTVKETGNNVYTTILLCMIAAVLVYTSTELLVLGVKRDPDVRPSYLTRLLSPLQAVNNYGPFAVMTTVRNEIQIEGSLDGQDWSTYEFRYKPGDPGKPLSWVIPHQPRLDWQMWFAALGPPDRNAWFQNLMIRLLQNKEEVTFLFDHNPFPEQPPVLVRARFYEYHFTSPRERHDTGNTWTRKLVAEYYPVVSLRNSSR